MPIYEYECNACGEQHEFIQKFSESPKRKCPGCGKSRLRKLVSAAAFHLKGSGWYVTDFRDGDKKKPADGDDASKSADESSAQSTDKPAVETENGAAGKSESKAADKSETKSDAKPSGKKKKPAAKSTRH